MKELIVTCHVVLILLMSGRLSAQTPPTTRQILDSLEVLKKVGGIVAGISYPPTAEEERFYNISNMLFYLPLDVSRKLMSDSNKLVRVYGFSVLLKRYFDSISSKDQILFNDTSRILLYTKRGLIDFNLTVGDFCEKAYQSTIETRKVGARESEIHYAVKHFIQTRAKFPESYSSIAFSDFKWSGNNDKIFFEIHHKYMLKSNDGREQQASHYFVLDHQLNIIMIESIRSNKISVYPPELQDWVNTFGL